MYIKVIMLNIIKTKIKNTYKKETLNKKNVTNYNKDFVPAVRDWKNSIYVYNKNTLSLIPIDSNYIMKLIRGYFTLSNIRLEKKLRPERLRRRSKKLSTNKIFLSDGEFKHTNDKVTITLYIYNRQKHNFLYKLKKKYIRFFVKTRFLKKWTWPFLPKNKWFHLSMGKFFNLTNK